MKPHEIEFEAFDGSKVRLKIRENATRWKEGRCWACYCYNHIYYIHLSAQGYATHGYCLHITPAKWNEEQSLRKGESIISIQKGKIVTELKPAEVR